MRRINVSTGTDTDRGIAALVNEITQGPSMAYIHGWTIERHVGDVDSLTVTFRIGAERVDQALLGVPAPEALMTAPAIIKHGDGPLPEQPISHAPTTCHYIVEWVREEGRDTTRLCGELIRYEPTGITAWVHAGDRYLGASDHEATPGPVAPPLPRFYNDTDRRQCNAVDPGGLDCSAPEGHEPPHVSLNGSWLTEPR